MQPVVVETTVELSSARADVWPLITDTDRTNRLMMGAAAVYKPIEPSAKSSARFVVETSAGGFAMSYEEAPFEWTLHESFSVYRRMRSGPLKSYTYGIELRDAPDGGTHAHVRLELVPRHWLLAPIARIQGGRIVASIAKLANEIDAHLRDKAPSPYLKPASPANEERLAYASRELRSRGVEAKVVDAIVDLLRSGPDADLVRVRPFEFADREGLEGRAVLRAMLLAVTLGLFELRWALVCPSCRTANDQVASLSAITDASHCQLCDLTCGVDLDRAVEATFAPHPSVREVTDRMFCIGGPWRTPHVLVQRTLDVGAERTIDAPKATGRHRLFARGGAIASVEVTAEGPAEASVVLEGETFVPAELTVKAGGHLRVTNGSAEPLHVKVERLGYASLAATAHVVTLMDEFRRLFSRDLLKPSTPLKVTSCTILFSDLTGSTALYTHAGDAAAFRLVDDHFDVLRKAIGDGGGAVVKTMGDAVMAAFVDPIACVRSAIACLRAFETFRATQPNGELTGLKLGLFGGPCYVVTANEAIDYFGQTVNCAARVQHLASSGEIVLPEEVFAALAPHDRDALEVVEHFQTHVKGVAAALRLVRTCLAAPAQSVGKGTAPAAAFASAE